MPRLKRDPPISLTERDVDLLVSVHEYRYLSTQQVQRLHFPSLQTAARRLRMLAAAGYVRTFRPLASQEQLVAIAQRGAEAVADRLQVPVAGLVRDGQRGQPKDYLFLRHFLAASDFRIALTQDCARSESVRLLGFLPEHLGESSLGAPARPYIRGVTPDVTDHRRELGHTPDGVFALERAGIAALFFLEIDRGTEVLTNPARGFLKIVRFYLSLLAAGGYQRFQADFGITRPFRAFRVLVVTSSSERVRNMRMRCGAMAEGPQHAKRFLWLTTNDALVDGSLLSREWLSLDPSDDSTYVLAPTPRPSSATPEAVILQSQRVAIGEERR